MASCVRPRPLQCIHPVAPILRRSMRGVGEGTPTETQSDNRRMEPRVAVAPIPLGSADGTFTIGRDTFPDFERLAQLGVHIQSDRVRVADPDPGYVRTGLDALTEACR